MKEIDGGVTAPKGFLAGGIHCGIKKNTRRDLALIFSQVPAAAAGVFTTNKMCAAPVKVCRQHLQGMRAQAIIASSGCANACTGEKGMEDAQAMTRITAEALGIRQEEVLVASTGPIGTYMPIDKVTRGVRYLVEKISEHGSEEAAAAILTTDLVTKSVAVSVTIGGKEVRIAAIAKGSGMIRPKMATMFCFITTDAAVDEHYLHSILVKAVEKSFNRIDVDGDTSTNDTVLCLANGMAGNATLHGRSADSALFENALDFVTFEMAKSIVRDGEGATKLIEVEVRGAKTEEDAEKACAAVCDSKLVKCAMYGESPGWGRILAAVGYSGAVVREEKVDIYFGKKKIVKNGVSNNLARKDIRPLLKPKELKVTIDLNVGRQKAVMWTCDLSHKYIDINL